jgi:uncharacterized damage-inducible protein DinB
VVSELAELHRFNAWANRSLMAGVRQLRPEQLEERLDGMYNSVAGVLTHLAVVEAGYLGLIRSRTFQRPEGTLPLDEVGRWLERSGAELVEVAESASLDETFHIPWFKRDFTVAQGLRQVLTHSINHRADVNQWLPRFGLESTDQDYIDLVLTSD